MRVIAEQQFQHLGVLTILFDLDDDVSAIIELAGGESIILDGPSRYASLYLHADDLSKLNLEMPSFGQEDFDDKNVSPKPSAFEFRWRGFWGYTKAPVLSPKITDVMASLDRARFYPIFHLPIELENQNEVLLGEVES